MRKLKPGKLSIEEEKYVTENAEAMTAKQIARNLGRAEEVIQTYMDLLAPKGTPKAEKDESKAEIKKELRTSQAWKILREEFNKNELDYFIEAYANLIEQFRGDVLQTEMTQIMQAIKFEILMNRNLVARRKALLDIERLENMQEELIKELETNKDADKKALLCSLEQQLTTARAAESSKTSEFSRLHERHSKLVADLKGTRDQRIQQISESKNSYLGMVKNLQQKEIQEREGRQLGLMRLATDREAIRLGRPHTYDNGEMDNPILSSDTLDLAPEGEEDIVENEGDENV